jgi:sulfhydrogenase subunit beta (sulfur reductase)
MIVKTSDLLSFLVRCQKEKLGQFEQVIVPRKSFNAGMVQTYFTEIGENIEIMLDSYRTVDPLRALFYFARETILPAKSGKKRLIVGVKSCDLAALKVLDRALINENFVDPIYQSWREQTTIVATDCMEVGASCHCILVDGKPWAEENFDINLSPLNNSYLITVGSKKGEDLLKLLKEHLELVQPHGDERDKIKHNRQAIERKLKEQNAQYLRKGDYENLRKSPIESWIEDSRTCVGCGGCTNICPTCYCIILNDETTAKQFVKVRSTDSCQLHGYAKVAGGATPRPKMYQRFRNRYLCKFDYMKSNFDLIGCVGCGRCIDVCPGEIEFRAGVQKNMQLSKVQE